jgi:hypothetical protein
MIAAGRHLVEQRRGALRRTLQELENLLPGAEQSHPGDASSTRGQ